MASAVSASRIGAGVAALIISLALLALGLVFALRLRPLAAVTAMPAAKSSE